MKKLFFLFALTFPTIASAQLLVDSIGSMGIGSGTSNNSKVELRTEKRVGIQITESQPISNQSYYSLRLMNREDSIDKTGVYIFNTTHSGSKKSTGVYSYISNPTSSSNYGVLSYLSSATNGAAIVGGAPLYTTGLDGSNYAGYFSGNVKVYNGTINGTLISDSDERLKENIMQMDEKKGSALDGLSSLSPITYNYKLPDSKKIGRSVVDNSAETDDEEIDDEIYEEDFVPSQVMTKTHFGFIAQELQQVYPELVYENDNGTLSVCYVELIPILVQSIKELNAKVEALQEANGYAKANFDDDVTAIGSPLSDAGTGTASMSQNIPNPFTDKTDIPIFLPESVKTATLCIYDLTGKQIEQHTVTGRGQTTMTIHADRMAAGMYLYALIADGKVVTSKRMIVSK